MDNGILWLTVIVVLAIPTLFFGGLVMLIRRINRPTVTTNVGATAPMPATAGANPAPANANTTTSTTITTVTWWKRRSSIVWLVLGAMLLFVFIFGVPAWIMWLFSFDWATRTALGMWLVGTVGANYASWLMWGLVGGAILLVILIWSGQTKKGLGRIKAIPFTTLIWVGVAIFFTVKVIIPTTTSVTTWLTDPNTPEPQTVTFARMNNQTVLGQQRTLTVTPLETWRLTLGRVSGGAPEGYHYVVCPTSSLSVLSRLGRNVFIGHQLWDGEYKYQFSQAAQVILVQEGIESITVTYSYRLVGEEVMGCTQETIQ